MATKKRNKGQAVRPGSRIYQRGPCWWIYYRDNGRTVQKSLKTRSRAVAEEMQKRAEAKLLTGQMKVAGRTAVSDFLESFTESLKVNNRRPRTLAKYDWAMRHFLSAVPKRFIDEFTGDDIDTFKKAARERDLKAASVNAALRHVKAVFQKAEDRRVIERNPFRKCIMLKVERKPPTFIRVEDVKRLLEHARSRPPYDLVVCLAALCGFRTGEIGGAIWQWFDFGEQTVTLQSRGDFQLKDWEARKVPLSSWALTILEPQRTSPGYVIQFPGRKRTGPAAEFKKGWKKLVKGADLPDLTIQQLRSTFGSLYLQQGVSLSKIALWMGHSSEDVTRRHYAGLMAYDEDIERVGL